MPMLNILLDTNIFIRMEDSMPLPKDKDSLALRGLANAHGHQLMLHPATMEELNRGKNAERVEANIGRTEGYTILNDPPTPPDDWGDGLPVSENDRVDRLLLYAIRRNAAHILVSEDKSLRGKARRWGIGESVFSYQEAMAFLRVKDSILHDPDIQDKELYTICGESRFFDSFRDDYPGFDDWYGEKSREGRKAWIYESLPNQPGSVLIYKEEKTPPQYDGRRTSESGRSLKLCSFKVAEECQGMKLGEKMLKIAFWYATKKKLTDVYLTVRQGKHDDLRELCEDYGFKKRGTIPVAAEIDDVFIKEHPAKAPAEPDANPLEYHIKFYPHFLPTTAYIVPVRPEFHEMLFPEKSCSLPMFSQSPGWSVGNAIKQAYLCHAKIDHINAGDILLFYRSCDRKAITTIGVVEEFHSVKDESDDERAARIFALSVKRTVYTLDQIHKIAKKPTKVILFRMAGHFVTPRTYDWLKQKGAINGPPQSIMRVNNPKSLEEILDYDGGRRYCFYAD